MSEKEKTFTISFRLNSSQVSKLENEASKYRISIHELARQIVIDTLDQKEKEKVNESLAVLMSEVEKLKFIIADSTEALLLVANYDKEKAKQFTTEQIRQR